MELAIVPREEARRFAAALVDRIPWDRAIQVLIDAMGATTWIKCDRNEYMEVPDHPTRIRAVTEMRDTVIGKPTMRQPEEHEEKAVEARPELAEILDNPEARKALELHSRWVLEQLGASESPPPVG